MRNKFEESYLVLQEGSGIKVGDKVKILCKAKSYSNGWENGWVDVMDSFVGKEGKVTCNKGISGICIRFEYGELWDFPFFVLEKIEKKNEGKPEEQVNQINFKMGDIVFLQSENATARTGGNPVYMTVESIRVWSCCCAWFYDGKVFRDVFGFDCLQKVNLNK